jgi:hypothetical protein
MMQALRGLGYSTAAALADIVDNSISAGATEVRINFDWKGEDSRISILDNGSGMNDAELEAAMTLGAINPLAARAASDLGRFGLGLKTASFSQCCRLTVASRRDRLQPACLRWDLEAFTADSDAGWRIFEGPAAESEPYLLPLASMDHGTLVLWEQLDRIVTPGSTFDDFAELAGVVESRLAMVFHRLLGSSRGSFQLIINGRTVTPWDPFMTGHPAKPWESPVARRQSRSGTIEVQCHVLPHKDKLSEEDFTKAGGPDGWTSLQGFYVYRNRRLLLAGGWLGLGAGRAWNREESHRLARIRVDIPNTADSDWKIDVKKSTARPPTLIRPWLTGYAEETRQRARKVFAFRGAPSPGLRSTPLEQAWRVEHLRGGIRYRIDENHTAVAAVIDACPDKQDLVRAMLRTIEETVPVQRIWLDTAENRDTPRTGFTAEPESAPEGVRSVLMTLFKDMINRRGISVEAALRTLSSTEPFQNYPQLVASLPTLEQNSEQEKTR